MKKPDWGNVCDRVDTCALSGAAALFTGIPHAEVLVNGPLWCYFYALRYLENVDHDASRHFNGTQPDNNAIVFGTEQYMLEALDRLKAEGRHPDVLFIESSCAMSLIGDDIAGIARQADLGCPIVTMDSGGVVGGFAEGFEKAARVLLDSLPLEEAVARWQASTVREGEQPGDGGGATATSAQAGNAGIANGPANLGKAARKPVINLLGLTPYYYNGKADVCEVLRLLNLAGLDVHVRLGCGSSYAEVQGIGAADLNVVVHAELGLATAKYLEKRLGTPWVCAGMPYGTEGTRAWLGRIQDALARYDRLRADMTPALADCDKLHAYLKGWMNDYSSGWGELWYDRVLVAAPGSVAVGVAQALRGEWLDTGELTVITQHDMTESGLPCDLADRVLVAGRDGDEIAATLDGFHDGLLVGSSSEFSHMHRGRNPNVTRVGIAYPMLSEVNLTRVPYCGTRGAVRLVERLANLHIQNKLAQQEYGK